MVKTYKGFKIVELDGRYEIYTKDEYEMGKGFRYPEHDVSSIDEAKEFIDCY